MNRYFVFLVIVSIDTSGLFENQSDPLLAHLLHRNPYVGSGPSYQTPD